MNARILTHLHCKHRDSRLESMAMFASLHAHLPTVSILLSAWSVQDAIS